MDLDGMDVRSGAVQDNGRARARRTAPRRSCARQLPTNWTGLPRPRPRRVADRRHAGSRRRTSHEGTLRRVEDDGVPAGDLGSFGNDRNGARLMSGPTRLADEDTRAVGGGAALLTGGLSTLLNTK